MDQSYIWIGYINIFIQEDYQPEPTEQWDDETAVRRKHREKVSMIIVTFLMLLKTFFFLRIFMKLSNLVTMMRQVISDLKIFMLFYGILVWMCALIFNILQMGNYEMSPNEQLQSLLGLPIYMAYPGKSISIFHSG